MLWPRTEKAIGYDLRDDEPAFVHVTTHQVSTYYVAGMVLNSADITVKKTDHAFKKLMDFWWKYISRQWLYSLVSVLMVEE